MTASFRPPRDRDSERPRALPHVELPALTVAMAVAPTVYTRNRMFAFFKDPEVRRARARAAQIRGIVRQLAGASGAVEDCTFTRGRGVEDAATVCLSYRIARIHLERHVELTELESACLLYLATKAGISGLVAGPAERALLDAALRRLAVGLELGTLESASR
jgi:hypothetical protein